MKCRLPASSESRDSTAVDPKLESIGALRVKCYREIDYNQIVFDNEVIVAGGTVGPVGSANPINRRRPSALVCAKKAGSLRRTQLLYYFINEGDPTFMKLILKKIRHGRFRGMRLVIAACKSEFVGLFYIKANLKPVVLSIERLAYGYIYEMLEYSKDRLVLSGWNGYFKSYKIEGYIKDCTASLAEAKKKAGN